ncbi:MAG: hypothetical protein RMJ81_00475 [Candidatus Kryptonium sp.]|nr:hypothetical protein [Candidatus Kryptonium sp.]
MKLPNILAVTLIMAIGCGITINLNDEYIYDKVFISEIIIKDKTGKITDTVKINDTFTTEIYGYFPDPCWQFYKIEVEELKNEYRITPIARRKKDLLCVAVIAPCSTSVALLCKTTTDTLKISVVGKERTISKTIKVVK